MDALALAGVEPLQGFQARHQRRPLARLVRHSRPGLGGVDAAHPVARGVAQNGFQGQAFLQVDEQDEVHPWGVPPRQDCEESRLGIQGGVYDASVPRGGLRFPHALEQPGAPAAQRAIRASRDHEAGSRPVLELRPEEHHRVMAVKNRGEVPPGHLALPLLPLLPHQHRPILLAEGPHLPPRPGFAILCRFPSLFTPAHAKELPGTVAGDEGPRHRRAPHNHSHALISSLASTQPPHRSSPLQARAFSPLESSAGSVFLV